jgi:hypothetical protein
VGDGAKLYPFYGEAKPEMSRIGKMVVAILLVAAPVYAQSFRPPDPALRPWSTAKMNIGPIYFSPTFELSNVGVDNNVFNDEQTPKSDITGTLGMRSQIGIHVGEGLVFQVTQNNQYHYYRRYRSERSVDSGLNFVLELRTRFFRPWARWDKSKTSQRLGFEIDERAERRTPAFDFGADINAAFRLGVSVAARRGRLRFKDDEEYRGQNLSQALDQQNDAYQGLIRYQVTELSEFLVGADYERDSFAKTPERDNDSRFYYAGLRIKTGAMFTGTATAGYREQVHKLRQVPDFKGVIADLNMSVAPSEALKLDVTGSRDMGYSYLLEYPFVVESGASATMTNRFSEHFDWLLSGRGRWLHYDETMELVSKPYTERTAVLGLGAGYYVGGANSTRLGLLYERWQRQSPAEGRSFHDNRFSSNYRFSF